MPDISMCRHETCEMRTLCWRHADSGTEPTSQRQAYQAYEPGIFGCRGFLHRTRLGDFAAEVSERLWPNRIFLSGLRGESITDTKEPDHD
jgi:hypothetical protein